MIRISVFLSLNDNMSIKKRLILAICIMIVSSSLSIYFTIRDGGKILFFDNASFSEFSDEKEEVFELSKDQKVKFIFKSSISRGEIYIEVRNSNNEVIYKNNSLKVDEEFTKKLSAGKYYYYLKASNISGYFTYKAQVKKI